MTNHEGWPDGHDLLRGQPGSFSAAGIIFELNLEVARSRARSFTHRLAGRCMPPAKRTRHHDKVVASGARAVESGG